MPYISPLTGRPMGEPLSQTAIDNVVAFFKKHAPKTEEGEMKKEWWEDTTPILDGGSDGQEYTQVFGRLKDGSWEYAIVKFTNDGHKLEVIEIYNGKATESVFR